MAPGLYALGSPDTESPVLVSANYKLTFDVLRKELSGRNVWLLILDTRGVNVWCAAGKGTFGNSELVKRIEEVRLAQFVSHRTLIVPQLGAPGVHSHVVKQESGFNVVFGPVRAADIGAFLDSGCKKDAAMSRVTFSLGERMAVMPVELVHSIGIIIAAFALSALYTVIWYGGVTKAIFTDFIPLLGAFVAGIAVFPALLPLLPFRAFALRGAVLGLVWAFVSTRFSGGGAAQYAVNMLMPVTVFFALNFTGSTTLKSDNECIVSTSYVCTIAHMCN